MTATGWTYERARALVAGERLPCVLVDLDILEENVRRLARVARDHGKKLRPASKSVRVPDLLRHIVETAGDVAQGVMCFSVEEARLLSGFGFDDLLVAYPTVQESDLRIAWEMTHAGRSVTLMIDEPEHVDRLCAFAAAAGKGAAEPLRVCIEVDMGWRPAGRHIGALRSPVRTVEDFEHLLDRVLERPELRLVGVMGYEAQVAGLGDENPFTPLLNPAKKLIRRQSIEAVAQRRGQIAQVLERRGVALEFFNGGGTGSISSTCREPWITEVTAGSGFLQSHLFDYYSSNANQPAFCFALQVTRIPQPDHVTCQSGGFIASGPTEPDKAPLPFLPAGLRATKMEGFGEVQTPLKVPPDWRGRLRPGDPVFFRPAKAGELAERFAEYLLVRGERVVARAATYRGLGGCFH